MYEILEDFFGRTSEIKMNTALLYCKENSAESVEYIKMLLEIPLEQYVKYASEICPTKSILPKDVIQFSSFSDATIGICNKLKEINNPGLKFKDVGHLLLNEVDERKDTAYIKYGENHAKTASVLGLVFEFYNTYYLSCIGEVYITLENEDKKKLVDRLIIRSPLVSRMIHASQNGKVNMREFLYMLSESTYIRRRSNIKKMIGYLQVSDEYDFKNFINKINF